MSILQHLEAVVGNLTRNLTHVETNIKTAEKAVAQLDAESRASIDQLLAKWEHPQAISQFITAVAQLTGLKQAQDEMKAAVAMLQAGATVPEFVAAAETQHAANEEAANNPLSAAGQSLVAPPLAPANEAAASIPAA